MFEKLEDEIRQEDGAFTQPSEEGLLKDFPKIEDAAFTGIIGEIVALAAANSESAKVAVAMTFISYFSAKIGRELYLSIGDSRIHCRPFAIMIGRSAKARKGTSEYTVRRIFLRANELCQQPLATHAGGLSSGEGLINAIRDASPDGEDMGVADKRLLVVEPEFGNILAQMKRDTSTLSMIIRNSFDGLTLNPLTKNKIIIATHPHVVILGHITIDELKSRLKGTTETRNGLLNRFLMPMVRRERLMPLPPETDEAIVEALAKRVNEIVDKVRPVANRQERVTMSAIAEEYWKKVYPEMSAEAPGLIGDLIARHDMYCLMLAMIFALLDGLLVIEIEHIDRARIWIKYMQDSIRYVFSSTEEQQQEQGLTELAATILTLLKDKPLSRTEISHAFQRNKSAQDINEALEHLLNASPPLIKSEKIRAENAKRPTEFFSCL